MGHHIPELSPVNELQLPLNAIRSTVVSELSARGGGDASSQNPVIVWATLASHVSRFALKDEDGRLFPHLLMLQSNSYRELLQNEATKATFANTPGVIYLDLFSPSLALGEIVRNVGDPVHFSSEFFTFGHTFVFESLMVAEDCHRMRDCGGGGSGSGSSSSNSSSSSSSSSHNPTTTTAAGHAIHHTKWNIKERLGHFNEKANIPFPGKIDYVAYAHHYVPSARPGFEASSVPPPPPPPPTSPAPPPPPPPLNPLIPNQRVHHVNKSPNHRFPLKHQPIPNIQHPGLRGA